MILGHNACFYFSHSLVHVREAVAANFHTFLISHSGTDDNGARDLKQSVNPSGIYIYMLMYVIRLFVELKLKTI